MPVTPRGDGGRLESIYGSRSDGNGGRGGDAVDGLVEIGTAIGVASGSVKVGSDVVAAGGEGTCGVGC